MMYPQDEMGLGQEELSQRFETVSARISNVTAEMVDCDTKNRDKIKKKCITDKAYESLNNTYERALVFMHKMPRIWLDYTKLLQVQRLVTRTRHTYDRALRSLPITQHDKIWKQYISFVKQVRPFKRL